MKIFVAGSGKLANAILNSGLSIPLCEILKWEPQFQSLQERAILVHAGSGRQLNECMAFCSGSKSVFIELATGLDTEKKEVDFPLIICPNTSLLVLKTLHMVQKSGMHFKNYEISITESHQVTKKTEPGTAYAFAAALDFPSVKIESIRDPEIQLNNLGIPREYLEKHAYHKIVMKDGSDEITIETKVLGHQAYAQGIKSIVEMILKHKLENKKYSVYDLIGNNLV